ncbi:S-layer homology domain-containing protein [Paenibacillus sp. FSL H3-0333]|uniref:S-layer homology domain-containing protein n=1 Tax=Paenibacillus sp. FSL H3-0333 TaxID=2921373 RepID=UPI0030FC550A
MQRMKKTFIWTLLLALLVSLVPPGLMNIAAAADKPTSYFTPDNQKLRNTVDLTLLPSSSVPSLQIARDNVLQVTDASLTVTGTFTKVTSSTLGANVQLLNWDQQNNKWLEDPTHVTPGVVQLDVDSPDNRFSANLTLYPGMNRITLTGSQGSNDRSEAFYVLFDKVPYVEKLQVLGGSEKLNLNEGAQLVVANKEITLEGKAQNATKVTVSLNDGTASSTSLLQDGTFFSQRMELKPGVNSLKLVVQNGSDTLSFQYSIFYYDEKNPIVAMYLGDSTGQGQDLLYGDQPVMTEDKDTASLFVQMMVPDNAGVPFSGSAVVKLDSAVPAIEYGEGLTLSSSGAVGLKSGSEILVPSPIKDSPAYRLVTFKIPLTLTKDNATPANRLEKQTHNLSVAYGTKTVNRSIDFQYMKNNIVITDMKYLPGYNGTTGTVPAGVALNGAKVDSGEFYILVKTNTAMTTTPVKLLASYLPLSTRVLAPEWIKAVSPTEHIFKITDFQNGNQTVRFKIDGSSSNKDVNISFASKSYIYVSNLTDGQTYVINSSESKVLNVKGQYIDFNLGSSYFLAEMYVNGLKIKPTGTEKWPNPSDGAFSVDLKIDAKEGPIVFGENKIVLTGTGVDEKGQVREVRKELRVYILDENVSTISKFQPALGTGRPTFPDANFGPTDVLLTKLFNLTPDFIYNDTKYTTSLKTYDLVLRGSGAVKLNLNMGTKNILSLDIPANASAANTASPVFADQRYTTSFAGSQKDFVMRIQDLTNDTPGTYIYTLELINSTGAKTSQKLELIREVSAYRILSPQPSVGTQYVVNKNFVHFDIEAEGATSVVIDKEQAVKRTDLGPGRFVLDYVGLKPDKANSIKIQIVRGSSTSTDTISIFYTGTVAVDSQYMAPKVADKYSVFNKKLELTFPKGTVMQSTDTRNLKKFYPDTKLRFGIAEPTTGVVERRNDYGNVIGFPVTFEESGIPNWTIPDEFSLRFSSPYESSNFVRISDVYWISGGLGELGTVSTGGYIPATNGLAPYSVDGLFGDPQTPAERKITPSKRGKLTLAFDSNVVDDAGTVVTVFQYNSNREWVNIGGTVDTNKHTISVPFDEFGYYKVMKMSRGYNDITNHQWARNILNALYSKGIMNNLRFEQFGTDDQTTRGEFATLLVKGLNLPLNYDSNKTYSDLVPGASSVTWDYEHIETASRAGIVTGLTDGVFGPDQPITREQAAVMIARALKLKLPVNDQKLKDAVAKSFLDSGKIESYALAAVQAVSKAKIMNGAEVTTTGQKKASYNFNPKANMTRAEAGKIAVELLKKSTTIFPKTLS